jgi:hypothetical protein
MKKISAIIITEFLIAPAPDFFTAIEAAFLGDIYCHKQICFNHDRVASVFSRLFLFISTSKCL